MTLVNLRPSVHTAHLLLSPFFLRSPCLPFFAQGGEMPLTASSEAVALFREARGDG